jgi:hypothetical protein
MDIRYQIQLELSVFIIPLFIYLFKRYLDYCGQHNFELSVRKRDSESSS